MTSGRAILLLCAACALLQLLPAGVGSLYNETDGQYAGAAKRMVQGGNWLIPENNNVPRLVKPPLLYWMIAGAFRVFGVNEFAARLPNALGVTAMVLATFAIGSRLGGVGRGLFSGVILLTSLGTATLSRIVMPEPVFCAFIAWAIYFGVRSLEAKSASSGWKWMPVLFWLCAGFATFTKGIHGLLYPLVALLMAGIFVREWRAQLTRLASFWGIVAFLAINVPWYFYIESRFPDWFAHFLSVEQRGHIAGSSAPATHYENVPAWQFLLLHAAWLFPWSIVFVIAAVAGLWRRRISDRTIELNNPGRPARQLSILLGAWGAVVVVPLLLLGERQDYYAMAAWPCFALAVAGCIRPATLRAALFALGVLCLAGLVADSWFLSTPPTSGESSAVAARATAWSTLTGFGPEVWLGLARIGLGCLGAALAAVLAGWIVRRRAFAALATAAGIFCLSAILGYALVAPYFSLARAANLLRSRLPAEAPIVFEGGIDTASSLLFYTDRPVLLLGQDPDSDFVTRKFALGRDRYLTQAGLLALWASERPLALVVERSALPRWAELLGPLPDPAMVCGTQAVLLRGQ